MEFRKKHLLAFFVTAVICVLSYIFHAILQTFPPSKEWSYSRIAGTAAVTSIRCNPHFREGVAAPLPQIVPGKQWNKFLTVISKEVLESVRTYRTTNKFHVSLNLTRRNSTLSKGELLCELKVRVPLGTIKARDRPFSGGGWENILPNKSLAETLGLLKTCAVVMSSGSIRNSTLGTEIAPTKGYIVDVGNNTTLRIINSQWYRKPDFDFFQTYKDYRQLHPQQPFYILSPSLQWDLWDVIQENTPTDIQPNPPSSGMLGIAVMMNLCEKISVYEFLPSHRETDLCHYFQKIHNRECIVGHYHPLTFEKNLVKGLNLAVDQYQTVNRFRVAPNLAKRNTSRSRREVLCQLKVRVPLGTIRAGHGPFSGEDWENVFPTESLAETLGPLNACAVVMSSGAMRNSTLGMEIDGHDAVLRFNAAPTEGYSLDVGTKTTLRLVNSKLMMSETDGFLTDPLYSTGVLMVWDPAPYSRDLYAWYRKPDFDFFQTYKDYRRLHPQQPFYILSPSMQWDLWDVIQENTPIDIQPNPPSSGMLGIAVMMNLCEKISVYEFLPSHRKTDLCHYFQNIHDWQCTLGYYHPLIFEKKLVSRLNQGSQNDIQAYGKEFSPWNRGVGKLIPAWYSRAGASRKYKTKRAQGQFKRAASVNKKDRVTS
ncbi:hypothetical protein AAFF_G00438520 [Aldrovandia affinis]|uniref:Beta-galactoside alpha-2,6-sialyltransferase 1 n=1 Tax=Aldrovandia affinis TaxID=143900 RepID=A0AAD7S7U3_9TELE|nr:hypothetical protein AAFF_G00438520 [Aldrovandia affinis]